MTSLSVIKTVRVSVKRARKKIHLRRRERVCPVLLPSRELVILL
jgi:hypothetical protein